MLTTTLLPLLRRLFRRFAGRADATPFLLPPPSALRPVPAPVRHGPFPQPRSRFR